MKMRRTIRHSTIYSGKRNEKGRISPETLATTKRKLTQAMCFLPFPVGVAEIVFLSGLEEMKKPADGF